MPKFNAGQFVPAALAGLVSHAFACVIGWAAAKVVHPSPGGGFQDIAAAVVLFIVTEAAILLAVLAGAVLLGKRHQRDKALGLVAGWLLGAIGLLIIWKTS